MSSVPSSYIPTSGATATRALETLVIPAANLASVVNTTAMSISLKGLMSYADLVSYDQFYPLAWGSSTIGITYEVTTYSSFDGRWGFEQAVGGVLDVVRTANGYYDMAMHVPFNVASRHGSTFINGANDGVALAANETPTTLADLSAVDIILAKPRVGSVVFNIQQGSLWGVDIGDAGIEEAST